MAREAATWLGFLAVTAAVVALWSWPQGRWEPVDLPGGPRASVLRTEGAQPLVILVQGAHLPPEFLLDPAHDLARRGFAVALVDLYASDDPADALARLAAHLESPRLALYAHSLGAQPALAFACAREGVGSLAVLGWDPSGPRGRPAPRNLLLAYGRYDDYVPVEEMLASLAQVAPGPAPRAPGVVTGSFGEGTARELFLAPWSQHGGEPFDPAILDEASGWFARAFARDPPPRPVTVALRHPLMLVALTALLAWLAWRRPPGIRAAAALAGLGLLAGVLPALPGVWLLLGLLLVALREPLAPRHLLGLVVAVNAAALLHRPEADWAVALGLYEFLFLPSQAYGLLHYWQGYGPWPWWALLGFLAALGGLVSQAPDLLRGWLARWTATVRRPAVIVGLAGLAMWKPVAIAALVYAAVVRLLTR